MILFKPTLLSHHCPLKFVLVLFLLSTKPQHTKASTLVLEGYKRVEASRDTSTLATGYQSPINSAGSGCSWNTYYESCYVYGGTVVFTGQARGASYSVNGQTVTYCSRYKRISFCTSNGLSTTSTSYGGVKITYNLVADAGEVAALYLSNDLSDACTGVCTDTDGKLSFPVDSKSSCDSYSGGWAAVNDNFDDTCAPPKETCTELVVSKGCEDTETHIVGTYYPTSKCSSSADADQTRSIYHSSDVDKYLFYRSSQDDWVFSPSCSDWFVRAYLEAGNEPYVNADSEVDCYDGGYTSNKRYTYTTFAINCKSVSSSSGGSGGGGYGYGGYTNSGDGGNGGMIAGIIIGFLVLSGLVTSIFIIIKKRRNRSGGTMMTSWKKKKTGGGVLGAGTETGTGAAPAQPVFPVTPAQEAPEVEVVCESTTAHKRVTSSSLVLETAPVVPPPPASSSEQETTFTPIAPPPPQADTVQVVEKGTYPFAAPSAPDVYEEETTVVPPPLQTADEVQMEEGGGESVARRLQELEKIKPLLTKKEYKMKRMAILSDL